MATEKSTQHAAVPLTADHPSDEEVLRGMLSRRYHYAKAHTSSTYQHTFRRKSRWELIRLSLLIVGIECTYATETAFVAPILLAIGLPHTLMTMMWAMPPIVGVLFVPVVASVSDRLRFRWGRRRPVLLALGIAMLLGMMLLPHGRQIGQAIGLRSVAWIATITTIGLTTTDFAAEASNGLCRTYAMEVCTIGDQARVLSTMMLIGGLGGMLGYLFGAIDWSALPIGQYFVSNEAAVFTANWFVLLIGLVSTLTSFPEIPLPVQEADELLRPVTHRMLQHEVKRLKAGPDADQLVVAPEQTETIGFRRFVRNIVQMPRSMKLLCLTQFLSHMGYLPYCLYFTDFVATQVYDGDVQAPTGSLQLVRYEEGLRFACWGMALFAASASLYSLVIERLIERFGARAVYVGGLGAHCVGMLAMGFVHERSIVLVCCALTGIMYATIYSIPFLLISHYHSKNSFAMEDGKCVESTEARGFGADVSMMSSVLCLAQLIVSLVMGAMIDAAGTTTVIIFTASGCTLLAAISAMSLLYMDL
ncbi:proton-associated sugar transporter A-like [Anopheles albimanus]|uniref:Major facilitator superfamily (MFS) profile domain-containing protein n=1 Tax=Anopheles albimanus TaxID=7167 RepID=A0A182FVP8_ANOAL|nr:proton-associated sugar transporter A-like [Anopheles albimanus]XP_035788292.1 proton-associated sugar transporter A-like [Anopheles albimanus]